jgi:ornithine decarboxylase
LLEKKTLHRKSRMALSNLSRIVRIIDRRLAVGIDDAFYIFDQDDLKFKYQKWVEKIPRVQPFYAMKCNDDEKVLKALMNYGTGFDCASKNELAKMTKLGLDPEKIIYAHTVKQISHLKFAAEKNIRKVTFDSLAELMKIKKYHPNAEVVLRIRFDAEHSMANLGIKFGCDPELEAPELIKACKSLNMNLIGISFHVGSGTSDHTIFERALCAVRKLFDFALGEGIKLNFVDIGGGFLGHDIKLLDNYAASINAGIDSYFKDPSVKIISEPGRYFAESAFALAVQIILKKVDVNGHVHYYINEGIHLSFMISYLYKDNLRFDIVRKSSSEDEKIEKLSSVWGSSCDSKDIVFSDKMLPELNIGDWLVFYDVGDYTMVCASTFNGFKVGDVVDY